MRIRLLIAAIILAGCAEQPDDRAPGSASTWSLRGTFTEEYAAEDVEAVCLAGTGNATCAMTRSFPPQYAFTFANEAECESARSRIAGVPHARPGVCAEAEAPSSPWRLSGSFTAERTEEDIKAVCRAGTGNDTCAIMESFPEQFAFTFASEADCDAARTRIMEVPHVNAGACIEAPPPTDNPEEPTSDSSGE